MRRLFILFLILFFISCDKEITEEVVVDWRNLDLSDDWKTGTRNATGINTEKLNAGLESAKELDNFYAIAIIYKGRLIVEEYKTGDRETQYPVWSVTKSYISALFGQMIDQGKISDEYNKLGDYYPDLADSLKREIMISQLLTMSSGVPDNTSYMAEDYPLQFIMDKDLLYPSGTYWNYTSAGTHVLSYILTSVVNESAKSFGETYLFPKLGMTEFSWDDDILGVSNGGFGLNVRLIDMAKFGQLFLQLGKSADEEIISSSWIQKSTEMSIPFNQERNSGYGYLWWMRIINSEKMYYAAGYGGQYIMVVPTRALVIAITSSSQSSGAYGTNLNRIFYEEIIGSFSSIY